MKAVVKNIYYTLFIFLIWYLVYLAKILDTVIPSPLSVINLILSKEIIIILDSLFVTTQPHQPKKNHKNTTLN